MIQSIIILTGGWKNKEWNAPHAAAHPVRKARGGPFVSKAASHDLAPMRIIPFPLVHLSAALCLLMPFIFLSPGVLNAQTRHHDNSRALADFLRHCIETHPESGVQDIYKTLYQEEFGVGHLIGSREAALQYLQRERATLDTTVLGETLLEPCGPDSMQWRVNLRPYFRAGGSDSALVDAMIASAHSATGRRARFLKTWEKTGVLLTREGWPALAAPYRDFTRRMRAANWPAVHHSPEYARSYKPAYRVLARSMLGRIGVSMPHEAR